LFTILEDTLERVWGQAKGSNWDLEKRAEDRDRRVEYREVGAGQYNEY
jgi:hypothetical protein